MLEQGLRFAGLLCAGTAAGITICVLLMERVWTGTGQFYTQLMQLLNRALTVPGPALGALGLFAIAADTVLLFRRGAGAAAWLGAAAVCLGLVAMGLTKFGLFPINDRVLQWDPANPPADWTSIQARWSALHAGRTLSAVGSFALYLLGSLLRE